MQEERFITEETSQSSDVSQMHIQHIVSKMDTLAGLAIKYGVEVILDSIQPHLNLMNFPIIVIF